MSATRARRVEREIRPRRFAPAVLLFALLAAPPGFTSTVDIPCEPVDWLLLPADSLVTDEGGVADMLRRCEEMGWSEKEYRIRKARLARGRLTRIEREAEKKRLATLAIRTGRDGEAIELIDPWRTADPEAVLAAGLAALRTGDNEEAARLLRAAQALGAPEGELVRFRLASALKNIPEEDRGLPLFLEIASESGGRFRRTALHEATLLYFDRGMRVEAKALLRDEYGASYSKLVHRELIFRTAEAEVADEEFRRAAILYKRLLVKWPDHRRSLESFRALRRLETEGTIDPDPRLPLLGAKAARSAGRTTEAIQLLRPLLDRDESDPLHQEALLEIGKAHYTAERYRSGLENFDRLAGLEGEKGRLAVLYRARCYKKMGDWKESIDAYEEYVRHFPESGLAPEVQWEISWRLRMLGEYEKAAASFQKIPVLFPRSDFARRAPLQEALCLDAAGKKDDAFELLVRIAKNGRGGKDRDDALFWIGVFGESRGDDEKTNDAYRELIDEFPETYYGLRAAGRLGEKTIHSPGRIGAGGETIDGTLLWIRTWSGRPARGDEPDFAGLPLYVAIGEWGEARKEASRLRKDLEDDPEGLLHLARICRRSTLFDTTIRCGRRIQDLAEDAGADQVHPYLLSLIYPLAWLDVVVAEAAAYDEIDPFFVLAIMRQESWFRPDAYSPAGARGLMQIIPSTGRHVARRLGEDATYSDSSLFEPETNIRYGIWYLRSLLRRYQGDHLVAASAYNAGEANADLWLAGGEPSAGGEYVERINFSETRNYVKRILSGYWICRSIYQDIASDNISG